MEWDGKWQFTCRPASGEKLSAHGHGAGKLWALRSRKTICSHYTEQRVWGVFRGPEERSRGVMDVLGKEMTQTFHKAFKPGSEVWQPQHCVLC